MLTIIGLVLIVGGLIITGGLILRALPRIAALSPSPVAPSKELLLKERILLERLTRRARSWRDSTSRAARSAFHGWDTALRQGYRRLRLLAQEYKSPKAVVSGSCETLTAEAYTALERGEWETAEERFLACLKANSKHREAYLGLSSLYRNRKEMNLAVETLRFLRKLYPKDPEVTYALAEVLEERGDDAGALREAQAALEDAPRNPKYLDFAIELAIVRRRTRLAEQLLVQLRETNPENQKLAEFEERIGELEN